MAMGTESAARLRSWLAAAVVLTVLVPGGPGQARVRPRARVTDVIDGDTVRAEWRGRARDIRLIGVDTPETVHPTEPVECYGPEASDFTTRRLEGERVRLEFDVERRDRYERTLAYIWKDGRLFNRTLVRRGFGTVSIYLPNDRYEEVLRRAEELARDEDRGLWGECRGSGGGGDGDGGDCHPSYPTVCIPPPPPDLDCADVPYDNFQVVGNDPHGFDGDGDGVGCET
jgi:micrococcal nuclease